MYYKSLTLDELLSISIYDLDILETAHYAEALREAYDVYMIETEEEIEELRQQVKELRK